MLKQNPGAGATLDKGSTVTLAVAKRAAERRRSRTSTGETQDDAVHRAVEGRASRSRSSTQPVDSQEGDGVVRRAGPGRRAKAKRGATVTLDRRAIRPRRGARPDDADDDRRRRRRRPRRRRREGRRPGRRALVGARGLARVRRVGAATACAAAGHEVVWVELARDGDVAPRRRRDRADARRAGCSAPTPCSRRCTARSARTARSRACSSCSTSRTSARACSRARCAWTRSLFKELMAHHGLPQVGYVAVDEGVLDGAVARIGDARAAVLGQAGAAGLVGRDRAGGRRRASSRARCDGRSATTRA